MLSLLDWLEHRLERTHALSHLLILFLWAISIAISYIEPETSLLKLAVYLEGAWGPECLDIIWSTIWSNLCLRLLPPTPNFSFCWSFLRCLFCLFPILIGYSREIDHMRNENHVLPAINLCRWNLKFGGPIHGHRALAIRPFNKTSTPYAQ